MYEVFREVWNASIVIYIVPLAMWAQIGALALDLKSLGFWNRDNPVSKGKFDQIIYTLNIVYSAKSDITICHWQLIRYDK